MSSLTEEQLQENPLAALPMLLGKLGTIAKGAGVAGKAAAGAAKVTKSGGAIVQGGAPKTMLGKVGKFAKDNPFTTYSIARDMNPFKGGGGGNQSAPVRKTGTVSASADLFDIVKGQLLDEGLSEEEIRDIMLELTPEEIMKEMNQGPSTPVSIDKVEFPKPGKKVMPKTGATYIGKVRPKPGFKMNPASGEVEKNENV